MIKLEKFFDNIHFMALLFYAKLLKSTDIIFLANYLTNSGNDNQYLIDILLYSNDSQKISNFFDSYLKTNNLYFDNIDFIMKNILIFIFKNIVSDNIDFFDGIKFIIDNVLYYKKSNGVLGDYLGISDVISAYYSIDDGDVKNKNDINDIISRCKLNIKSWLIKNAKEQVK